MEGEREGERGGGREGRREGGREGGKEGGRERKRMGGKRGREKRGDRGEGKETAWWEGGRVETNMLNLAVMYSNFTIAYPPNELEFHDNLMMPVNREAMG